MFYFQRTPLHQGTFSSSSSELCLQFHGLVEQFDSSVQAALLLWRLFGSDDFSLSRTSVLHRHLFLPPPAGLLHKLNLCALTSDLSAGDPGASQNHWVVFQRPALCRLYAADSSVSILFYYSCMKPAADVTLGTFLHYHNGFSSYFSFIIIKKTCFIINYIACKHNLVLISLCLMWTLK